ncbi:MAG: LacI family DNA-binding transcriptional regulator [Candidatus Limiplasma sp.]|nr:LacI family DNA-binding transcriptional regulator [Candidatus Limiplasma sp.]
MTIKEIAQLCGVSRGTVDRVLNHRGKVKPETEALILRTIHRMGYTKNIAGKALTVKKSAPVFGALVSSEGNPFFDEVIAGFRKAEEELVDYGVTVLLKTMRGYDVDRQLTLIDELAEAGMTVLVVQPINDARIEERIRQLAEKGVATITVNTDIENSCRLCYVGSDYTSGGETAAGLMRLVTGGQANLGIVTGVTTLLGHVLRLEGFERHLREICPDVRVVDRVSANDDMEHSYRMTLDMLRRHPEIDTLFVVASGTFGACRAIIELGCEKTMRMVSFDNVPSTIEMMRRGLVRAVVCQQPFLQGYQAIRAAFDILLTGASKQGEQIIMENQIKILENL